MRLEGKVAVVTGAAQGIGKQVASTFSREGARVVLGDVQEDKVAAVAEQIKAAGGHAVSAKVDVAMDDQVEGLIDLARHTHGRLDVVVNNAGIGLMEKVTDVEMADYDRVMNANMRGVFLGAKFGARLMIESGGGAIINIASVHGIAGWPGQSVYAATKAGIIGSTRAMACDLASDGIRVNAISPGAIWLEHYMQGHLELADEDVVEFKREFGDRYRDGHRYAQMLERVGETEDIANCALFLAGDEARFITGQNIAVDGGLTTAMSWERPLEQQSKINDTYREIGAWAERRKEKGQ